MVKEIIVLRYGHRIVRDFRVTSHCCLVARAFGASKLIIEGEEDRSLKESVDEIVKNWGGSFKVEFAPGWRKVVKDYSKRGFKVVHATMYGEPLQEKAEEIRKLGKILLLVGGQKVEGLVYDAADYNISVTSQPHSEIAAIAVVLDWLFGGKELGKKFKGGKLSIVPQKRGKKVLKSGN